ncbi:MAG: hypothetical protein WDW38_010303 [Sanguina aurantia]
MVKKAGMARDRRPRSPAPPHRLLLSAILVIAAVAATTSPALPLAAELTVDRAPCSNDPAAHALPQCQQPASASCRPSCPRTCASSTTPPDFAVVISVHNHGHVIRRNLEALARLTRGIWQLVVVFDDCSDASLAEANAAVAAHIAPHAQLHAQVLAEPPGADAEQRWDCQVRRALHRGMDLEAEALTAQATPTLNQTSSARSAPQGGDAAVRLHSLLTEVTFIVQPSSVWETTSDNLGLAHAAPSRYFILVQADMRVLSPGWNLLLSAPAELHADIFAVSARCAHPFPGSNSTACYGRCSSDVGEVPTPGYLAEHRHRVYLPGTVSRGPLLLRADRVVALGLLDEQNFMLGDDDHDLMARALTGFGWRAAGYLAVAFVAPPQDGSSRQRVADKSWSTWARDTVMRVHRAVRTNHRSRRERLAAALLLAVPEVREMSEAELEGVLRFWGQRLRHTLTCGSE